MARKFILVPSDQFLHLQTCAGVPEEEPLLEHTKRRIGSILASPRLNVSEKRALYDQEHQRLLRQRRERADRPVNVTVAGFKPTLQQPYVPKRSVFSQTAQQFDEDEEETYEYERRQREQEEEEEEERKEQERKEQERLNQEEQEDQQEKKQEEEEEWWQSPKTPKTASESSRKSSKSTPESSKATPETAKKTPRGVAKRAKEQQNYVLKVKIEELIKKYPRIFGVDANSGGLINPTTQNIIRNSDWQTSLNYLTGRKGVEIPGTAQLDRVLRGNKLTQDIYGQIRNIQIGNGFIPSLWK